MDPNQKTESVNGPGLSMTERASRSNNLRIDAPCSPTKTIWNGLGLLLPCGGTLTATAQHPVIGQAQLVDAAGNPQGGVQSFTLQPGETFTLSNPPTHTQWLIVDMTQGQADGIALGILGGVVLVGGLAAYGGVRFLESRIAAHRRKKAQQRFTRWFWGA